MSLEMYLFNWVQKEILIIHVAAFELVATAKK